MREKTLLIIWHSRTGASEALAKSVSDGAGNCGRLLRANEVSSEDICNADGLVIVCPENLASMSGEMKEMFDRCYYPVLGQIEGRPYATIIAAGSDGHGAQQQIDRIMTGWRLRRVCDPSIVNFEAQTRAEIEATKLVPDSALNDAQITGKAIVEGLQLGIY